MDIEGYRLFTILDKDGGLIDLRLTFTAIRGPVQVLYGFDAKSSNSKQKKADQAIENSKTLARMKESVKKIGVEASNPVTQRVTADIFSLVPNEEGPARILIGKVEKDRFSVRMSIDRKKGEENVILEVPFDGDPGNLKGKSFQGEAFYLVDGRSDVAKIKLEIANIGN